MTCRRRLLLLLTSLALCAPAGAATLDVELGWAKKVRGGRWTPIFITASDSKPRNVTIELDAPHDGANLMRVRQNLTLNPQPVTVALYAPLANYGIDELSVVLRDAATDKVLARWPDPDGSALVEGGAWGRFLDANTRLVGVTGEAATLRTLERQLQGGPVQITAAYLEPKRLPFAPIGFDSLDLLVLNAPNFDQLGAERQQAIVDWVRGGGCLLLWPGENPVPERGPLIDALPVRIGGHTNYGFTPETLDRLGLGRRFRSLKGRELAPNPGATALPLFGDGNPPAYRARVGFGDVFVSPVDLGQLQFDGGDKARAFWAPILRPAFAIADAPSAATTDPSVAPPSYSETQILSELADRREVVATEALANRLANVPGAGRFDFTYVAVVMVGMMLVVGPIDWFVLKRIGRQPWTWVTTSGWIALVTVGAVFIGHWLRSGELHYRTVRLVDQADGAAVAATDFVAIYAPKTDQYAIAPESGDGWWEPVSPGGGYGYRRDLSTDWRFHQTYRGNEPGPMTINVWNMRFLRGQAVEPGAPAIEADLGVGPPDAQGRRVVRGTVTNRGPAPLERVIVRTRTGAGVVEGVRVAPGETAAVTVPLDPNWLAARQQGLMTEVAGNYGQMVPPAHRGNAGELALMGADLDARASLRVDQLLRERDDLACVYATASPTDPAVKLPGHEAVQQHILVLRALVPLRTADH
jgi:hypothetical protein